MTDENMEGLEKISRNATGDSAIPTMEEMNLSARSYNCLIRAGIDTTKELLKCTYENVMKVRNLNQKCVDEIVDVLKQYALTLAEKDDSIGYYKSNGDYARKEYYTKEVIEGMRALMRKAFEKDIDKKLIQSVKTMSEQVDRIFYFVNPKGLQFKSKRSDEICARMAQEIGIKLYGERSGPEINNPVTLLEELKAVGIEKFEIIYFCDETGRVSLLSHKMKEQLLTDLKTGNGNSGEIAKIISDSEEGKVGEPL